MGGPGVDVIDKNQAVVGEPSGRGWRGRRRRNEGTGLSEGASFALAVVRRATPAFCSARGKQSTKVSLCQHQGGRWSWGTWGEDDC